MDEYMNLVIDDAEELSMKKDTRKTLGTTIGITRIFQM